MTNTVSDLIEKDQTIRAIHGVEIQIEKRGLVCWINVDGICCVLLQMA